MKESLGANPYEVVGHLHAELRRLIDATPAMIHTGRADGYLDYFKRRWLTYVGATLDEVCGWRWKDFIHPDDGEDARQEETNSTVVGWDDHGQYAQRIRNYTDKPIDVEIRRSYDGHVMFRGALEAKLHDYRTVQFTARVDSGDKKDLLFEVVQRQGHNAKQSNVTLGKVDVE